MVLRFSFFLLLAISLLNCTDHKAEPSAQKPDENASVTSEKRAILEVLNGETRAAFQRDYTAWKTKWVQEPYASKSYMNFADSSMTETLGWNEINAFVKTYIEEHPEPDPLPEPLQDIDVRLYGTGAWVTYEQQDPARGRKKETRLMEKINGQWKIAGMQTVIYGFADQE